MNREDFISRFRSAMGDQIPVADLADIIADYDEHFRMGALDGRTEEEIAVALGDPAEIAREWRAITLVRYAETHSSLQNIGRAILATVGLGLFNIIVILIPAIIIFSLLLVVLITGIFLVIAGPAMTIASFGVATGIVDVQEILIPWAGFFFGIGLFTLGLLVIIADAYVARWTYHLAIRYLQWNIAVIQGREGL